MIDFAALVLGPAMAVFGQPVTFTPTVSQPAAQPYAARGVFAQKQVQTRTSEGVFTDVQPTLGIKVADFAVPPKQGDSLVLSGDTWFVWDVQPDGQGGIDLVLNQSSP